MRTTKALLLAAAIGAAGVASSMAQTVYSVNVVGFVNLSLTNGFNMICNPLKATNDLLSTIIPTAPDFTSVYKWDVTNQVYFGESTYFGGWGTDYTLAPGEGFFVSVPENTTLTFVGEVRQGTLTTPLYNNFQIVGSQVPQQGGISGVLGYTPDDFDTVFQWIPATQNYVDQTYFGGWGSEPNLAIGEAVFLQRSAPGSWTRTFNVNP